MYINTHLNSVLALGVALALRLRLELRLGLRLGSRALCTMYVLVDLARSSSVGISRGIDDSIALVLLRAYFGYM